MAISRYMGTDVIYNDDTGYQQEFKHRFGRETLNEIQKINELPHFETIELKYPTLKQLTLMSPPANHIWGIGDRYYKLADKYYGSAEYWWIIAWFNKKPTENHIKVGDVVLVPTPLMEIINIIGL
jgi:hypothetical protein|tara:strand:+ start:652 stop:1026 length:375 start_codon:yes stop_codon:yes gene_type:complete